jgi:arginyl-tRNA synthetase
MSIRQQLTEKVQKALAALYEQGFLGGPVPGIFLVPPKQADHGDFACTIALSLAKAARKNPQEIAKKLQEKLGTANGLLSKTEIAGPGYLNLFVAPSLWLHQVAQLLMGGEAFIQSDDGHGKRVLLEYVSANPTGPLHIAHGRGAVTGDGIARLLKTAGYQVEREYYVNDLGNQSDVLARSIHLRYGELHGLAFTAPEDFYPGEYITDIAQTIKDKFGSRFVDKPEAEWIDLFRSTGIEQMLVRIKTDLKHFGIEFDHFVSERALMADFDMRALVQQLREAGHVFDEEGKIWFRSTTFGDDKDRVLIREDGRPTYFAGDVAYHWQKLRRGYDLLINVWGADHGGYVARVRAAISALGYAPDILQIVLVQMVSLSSGGQAVRMGKRLGTAVWLSDVLKEAGSDATRYFFLMRRSDAQMDFDVELATKKSLDNPVYYAQMGYARLSSILRKAKEQGIELPNYTPGALDALVLPEEIQLMKLMTRAPDIIADAARLCESHLVVHYLQELIALFHSYYTQYKGTERVISEHADKTRARLLMCEALRNLLAALLHVLGVSAPESMYHDEAP